SIPAKCGGIGDPSAHRSGTDDADRFHVHARLSRCSYLSSKNISRSLLQQLAVSIFIKAKKNLSAAQQNRPLDKVRNFGHERNRVITRRRLLRHVSLAIQLIARIQKSFVVALTDQ